MKMKSYSLGLVVSLISSQGFGWGDIGHQTVGEIAQRYLTPEAQQKIEQIMGAEILQASAIWPDIVRSDDRHKTYSGFHFLDVPVGTRYVDISPEKKAKRNGDTVIRNFGAILQDKKRTRDEKMIAIRYLVHVIGDVHQPLHVGNSLDMGANTCNVSLKLPHLKDERILNLHSLWDEEIIEFVKEDVRAKEIAEAKRLKLDAPPKRFFGASSFADMIVTGHKDILGYRAEIETADPVVWYQEAADIRTAEVYPDQEAGLTAPVNEYKRPYCVNIKDSSQKKPAMGPPVLGAEYLAAKVQVIEKQIYKAGLRLAHNLNSLTRHKDFTKYSANPSKNMSCPLKAKMRYRDPRKSLLPEKEQWTEENVDTVLTLSPSEQGLAKVLAPQVCDDDFLKNFYLAQIAKSAQKK